VVQVKKNEVRDAILSSARELFSSHGYHETKLTAIAAKAKVGVGNIYSYFPSKLHLLYEIYRPWFEAWLIGVEAHVRTARGPRKKLQRLIVSLWHDFPAVNPGLANSLMEALASNHDNPRKPDDLLQWTEQRVTAILKGILPPDRMHWLENNALSHILLMAQDGFVINYRWGDVRAIEAVAATMTGALLGSTGKVSRVGGPRI
jgi:AcrR family transcriptional regulator